MKLINLINGKGFNTLSCEESKSSDQNPHMSKDEARERAAGLLVEAGASQNAPKMHQTATEFMGYGIALACVFSQSVTQART